jgi:DNA-binding MarR family transcriptional regulator
MQLLQSASNLGVRHRDCARAVLDGVPSVVWFIRRHMRRHRTRGLSVPQFRTLLLLEQTPTACLSAAAENLGCSVPGASRLISGLVLRGLVARSESPDDRRHVSLELTPRGRSALRAARQATLDLIAGELRDLDDQQCEQITEAVRLLQSIFVHARGD